MTSETVFLDANIFMYAAGTAHVYKEPCIQLLTELENGHLRATINTEIIQELLYRYSHIGLAEKGLQLSRDVMRYPLAILSVAAGDIYLAIDIYDSYRLRGLKPRDAIHAAVMQRHQIRRIVSTDRHFDVLPTVERIDPLTYISQVEIPTL